MVKENKKLLVAAMFFLAIVRLGFAGLIFYAPLLAVILTLIADSLDYDFLAFFGVKRQSYQLFDKYLDFGWYIFILIYLSFQPLSVWLWICFVALFVYRLIGEVIFCLTKDEKYLFFFANLFEPVFWLWLIFPALFSHLTTVLVVVFMLLPFKLLQEHIIHVAKMRTMVYFQSQFKKDWLSFWEKIAGFKKQV
ncbi:hypothetical protein MUP65_02435 [Patescibacteria group bacterium]|nr:hypothetical protein [Patescibacteria group bacterium]